MPCRSVLGWKHGGCDQTCDSKATQALDAKVTSFTCVLSESQEILSKHCFRNNIELSTPKDIPYTLAFLRIVKCVSLTLQEWLSFHASHYKYGCCVRRTDFHAHHIPPMMIFLAFISCRSMLLQKPSTSCLQTWPLKRLGPRCTNPFNELPFA